MPAPSRPPLEVRPVRADEHDAVWSPVPGVDLLTDALLLEAAA